MKIKCACDNLIIDQTDYLAYKGYMIPDKHWFHFWDAIDKAIEEAGNSMEEKEKASMQLRQQNVFRQIWECTKCGKLYIDSENGKLISYSPDSNSYNKALDTE